MKRGEKRVVDEEIQLIPYYPNDAAALKWYLDPDVCRQVDNRDGVYDLPLLRAMYRFLDKRGLLFYVKYRNRLCGDVCLQESGEVNIVIAKPYQNKRIGRRVMREIIALARELNLEALHAEIYAFNGQSRRMFESVGFHSTDAEHYIYELSS